MKFEKAVGHQPMKPARILLHTGVGLGKYRYDRDVDTYLEQDVNRLAAKFSNAGLSNLKLNIEKFPEYRLCEHEALEFIMRKIARILKEGEVLSIVTSNTWLAQTIAELMVRQGLSIFLHVFSWADERLCHVPISNRADNVIHGWFPDQNTRVAMKEFELAPRKLDYLDNIDFTEAMHAALDHR